MTGLPPGPRGGVFAAFGVLRDPCEDRFATLLGALRLRPRDDRTVRPAMRAAGVGQARTVELVVTARV